LKTRSYISLILSLCFAVFLGHNLIPHHHHAEQLHVPLTSECPIEHSDGHDHDHGGGSHPLHCHAFNDVVFHKYNSAQLPDVSRDISTLFVPVTLQVTPLLARDISTPYLQIKIPDKLLACKGALSLRAPPYHV